MLSLITYWNNKLKNTEKNNNEKDTVFKTMLELIRSEMRSRYVLDYIEHNSNNNILLDKKIILKYPEVYSNALDELSAVILNHFNSDLKYKGICKEFKLFFDNYGYCDIPSNVECLINIYNFIVKNINEEYNEEYEEYIYEQLYNAEEKLGFKTAFLKNPLKYYQNKQYFLFMRHYENLKNNDNIIGRIKNFDVNQYHQLRNTIRNAENLRTVVNHFDDRIFDIFVLREAKKYYGVINQPNINDEIIVHDNNESFNEKKKWDPIKRNVFDNVIYKYDGSFRIPINILKDIHKRVMDKTKKDNKKPPEKVNVILNYTTDRIIALTVIMSPSHYYSPFTLKYLVSNDNTFVQLCKILHLYSLVDQVSNDDTFVLLDGEDDKNEINTDSNFNEKKKWDPIKRYVFDNVSYEYDGFFRIPINLLKDIHKRVMDKTKKDNKKSPEKVSVTLIYTAYTVDRIIALEVIMSPSHYYSPFTLKYLVSNDDTFVLLDGEDDKNEINTDSNFNEKKKWDPNKVPNRIIEVSEDEEDNKNEINTDSNKINDRDYDYWMGGVHYTSDREIAHNLLKDIHKRVMERIKNSKVCPKNIIINVTRDIEDIHGRTTYRIDIPNTDTLIELNYELGLFRDDFEFIGFGNGFIG